MSRLVVFFLFFVVITPITNGLNPRKLDEGENKCGGCPCNKPCDPPSPPPPPPALPPPSPPPPKKPPSGYNCPHPPYSGGGGGGGGGGENVPYSPNSQCIYMAGPPGDLYPVDHDVGGAKRSFSSGFSLVIGGFFLGLILVAMTILLIRTVKHHHHLNPDYVNGEAHIHHHLVVVTPHINPPPDYVNGEAPPPPEP